MKTLLILSALATIAIAAPAPDEYTDDVKFKASDFTISQQREKKSTISDPLSNKSPDVFESNTLEKITDKSELGSTVARTFSGFKKPIIVKKKIGYQLYRDSDEEQAEADPRETCRKQIKVKLCDDTNSDDKMKSTSIDHIHESISDHELENNIKMAKEAVEMFQSDLRKMDHDMSDKARQEHMALGEDRDLQEDIEKARVALEHIQRKFRNLDLITASKEVDNSDTHFKMIKPEEDRLAQWKKAMENNNRNFEIARNLEDNFKVASEIDPLKKRNKNSKDDNTNNMKLKKLNDAGVDMRLVTAENNLDMHVHSKESKAEDTMTSVTEDTKAKMQIHSDSLKKSVNEDVQQKEQPHEAMNQSVSNKETGNVFIQQKSLGHEINSDCNEHENTGHDEKNKLQADKERENEDNDNDKMKTVTELKGHNSMRKLSGSNTETDAGSKSLDKSKDFSNGNNQQSDHPRLSKTDDLVTHESQHIDSHDLKNHNERVQQQLDIQRSSPQTHPLEMQRKLGDEANNGAQENKKDIQRSSLSMDVSNSDKQQKEFIIRNDDHADKVKIDETTASGRATTNLHKEILNNMDFSEDSHQVALSKLPLKETEHILKNEKSELHERLNVPQIQPDSEHLRTMMHISDSSQHKTIQDPTQLKMTSMFINESPNFNGKLNNMPLREAAELHNQHEIGAQLSKVSSLNNIPTDLHDPLKIRWAHENNMNFATMKDAQPHSQFHKGDTEMFDGSEQLNIENAVPFRTSVKDGQHLQLHDQMNTKWAQQSMNIQKSADMNSGLALQNPPNLHITENVHHTHPVSKNVNNFDVFVNQDNFMPSNDHMMMHSSHNLDSSMQPSTFINMRSMPKMAFEHTGSSHWAHNNGAFRTSYGPGIASYGTSSGPAPGSYGGGSNTVGYFPNANVGNCAVPLLLSCSPSVVSGSLAKTNTYSAPAYRSDDSNFLKKRDIDVNQATLGVKMHRHANENNKPHLILENKQ